MLNRGGRWPCERLLTPPSAHNVQSTLESFFATLKNEMYHTRSFATREEARHAVVEYIEAYYNRKRPHSTIGYRIPAEAMDAFFERTKDGTVQVSDTVSGKALGKAA